MLQLNVEKINSELERMRYDRKWLSKKLGVSSVMMSYIFKRKPLSYAERIAEVLNISARDLIKDINIE